MRFVSARQLFSGKDFLSPDTVLVLNQQNKIQDFITLNDIDKSNVEFFDGIITPGFINSHCHLELSHLKGFIKERIGIVDFGLSVMKHRHDVSNAIQTEAMAMADREMQAQGIVAVGDISNTTFSLDVKTNSELYYHTFIELIALDPKRAKSVFEVGKTMMQDFTRANLACSLAPHAPYSTSLDLIQLISNHCSQALLPTTIHNQESNDENSFFENRTGNYIRLYDTIKLPIDYFKETHKSSLQSIINALHQDVRTLLVHNTFTQKLDIEVARRYSQNLYWCLCPNANLYIENTLPNINLLNTHECVFTIGTDSLASNHQLSIIDEVNTILKFFPEFPLPILLKAATHYGAQFLGIEDRFGELRINSPCGINLVEGTLGNFTVKKLA